MRPRGDAAPQITEEVIEVVDDVRGSDKHVRAVERRLDRLESEMAEHRSRPLVQRMLKPSSTMLTEDKRSGAQVPLKAFIEHTQRDLEDAKKDARSERQNTLNQDIAKSMTQQVNLGWAHNDFDTLREELTGLMARGKELEAVDMTPREKAGEFGKLMARLQRLEEKWASFEEYVQSLEAVSKKPTSAERRMNLQQFLDDGLVRTDAARAADKDDEEA